MRRKRPFDVLDDLRFRRIGTARFSPDGRRVVYELTEVDLEREESLTSLWVVEVESGTSRRLTFAGNSTAPDWSPDGRRIAFVSDRDGASQVFVLPIDGGEARRLTDRARGVGGEPVWSPDGRRIAFTAHPDAEPRDESAPYRVTRFIWRFDALGNLDDAVREVFVVGAEEGTASDTERQLTNDAHVNVNLRWSPDGRELLCLSRHDPDRPELFSARVRVLTFEEGGTESRAPEGRVDEIASVDWGIATAADWSIDGGSLVVAASTGDLPMATKFDVWMIDRATGRRENRTADMASGGMWFGGRLLRNENTAWLSVVDEGRIGISGVGLTGPASGAQLVGGDRAAELRDASERHLLFLARTLENPGELCVARLDGGEERQLTHVNDELVDEIDFPALEQLSYRSPDGTAIQGWALLPVEGSAPYPTVLYIHGGPHGAFDVGYAHDMHVLAGAGYAVLFVNPRGSRGYGDEFATTLSGNWGVMDHEDLLAGVDHLVELGIADPDRLGIAGLSYGGYLTCFTVGQTRRFKAAVAENPITNLVSRYGTADMGPWGSLSELGGPPHEIPDVYRRSSPVTYAHDCTTPTLLLQSEDDFRCPAGQSEEFYSILKASGCTVEMVRYPKASHAASHTGSIAVRKSQNAELVAWMSRFV